ncbi:M15 family metallopeptidase [Evansella tamaricis]|uniref:D-alanyl-D-alanine dipeptidase n=1 Tax=Evansella tamaricis TaxID=2069301 RepID=A0ABS6JF04_9BACI|nr:M15 family metallopeptidase [Evansella tamaricis]MBU9711975.1 M15 family metallopeptidase [Evansella tamaricis]
MDARYKPIPPIQSPTDWASISIYENNEPLVGIRSLNSPKLLVNSMYFLENIPGSLKDCYVREEVVERLIRAAALLPDQYSLLIWDGYRPYKVQNFLYTSFYEKKKNEFPDFNDSQLESLVKKYVSLPSIREFAPSPHLTGGSVDLTIAGSDGNPIEMGTEFDDFSEKASTRFFENLALSKTLHPKEQQALENRRLLYWIMRESGFTSYVHEWWHFDYGNQWHGELSGTGHAKYGVAPAPKISFQDPGK